MTMENKYLIGIDQSTQGTKALLLDAKGNLIKRVDKAHRQIIDEKGFISHDPREIYQNTLYVVQELIQKTQIDKRQIAGLSISNQRETTLAWKEASLQDIKIPAIAANHPLRQYTINSIRSVGIPTILAQLRFPPSA